VEAIRMTLLETSERERAASLAELREAGRLVVALGGHTVCLFAEGDEVHAVDNRCPHMGFPLHRGTVNDGILICHWHHARFDLCTGGTFDQWADELRRFAVEVENGEVYVDVTSARDPVEHQRARLQVGL
jgi:nitrite reductase/ring-hydroxylating ferredoxin subunit